MDRRKQSKGKLEDRNSWLYFLGRDIAVSIQVVSFNPVPKKRCFLLRDVRVAVRIQDVEICQDPDPRQRHFFLVDAAGFQAHFRLTDIGIAIDIESVEPPPQTACFLAGNIAVPIPVEIAEIDSYPAPGKVVSEQLQSSGLFFVLAWRFPFCRRDSCNIDGFWF